MNNGAGKISKDDMGEKMMKNLIIIGAGGCGREVLQWAKDINEKEKRWNIKGFIDDDINALDGKICSVEVLSEIDGYEISAEDEFVCCIGNSAVREKIVEKMKADGARFTSIVHPTGCCGFRQHRGERHHLSLCVDFG